MDGRDGNFVIFISAGRRSMISTDHDLFYPGTAWKSRSAADKRGGQEGGVSGKNGFLEHILEAAGKVSEKEDENASEDHGDAAGAIDGASKDDKATSREALMQVISGQKEEILKKLKNGDTGVKIPIGSMSLTEEEWEKLLKGFDDAQEKIREAVRAESGEELPEKRPDTTVNGDRVLVSEDTGHDIKSLEDLISESGSKPQAADDAREAWQAERTAQLKSAGVERAEGFGDYLPGMQVITKVGDCSVSPGVWGRTDFPFWEYFKKGTSADALNDWQPKGAQPSMLDPRIQSNLQGIGYGKVSILIPEKLQARMDADPAYADEIYRRVAKWKEDYDARDNATAASLGMNVAAHQFSKSYCIQLDEDGNVGNFTVVGGGLDITESKGDVVDNWTKRRNAAILFHRQHLARMGYVGITGTAGIVAEEGGDSPLALLRAALMGIVPLPEEERKKYHINI